LDARRIKRFGETPNLNRRDACSTPGKIFFFCTALLARQTEIYLQALAHALEQGKGAIVPRAGKFR